MEFKAGDKVKVVSLENSISYLTRDHFLIFLNKTFTVCGTIISNDSQHDTIKRYVIVKENTFYWNDKDLILVNNNLEIE